MLYSEHGVEALWGACNWVEMINPHVGIVDKEPKSVLRVKIVLNDHQYLLRRT